MLKLVNQQRGLLTVRQAARSIGIDPQNVYAAIWGQRLLAKKFRGKWLIPLHEVQRYAVLRNRTKRS